MPLCACIHVLLLLYTHLLGVPLPLLSSMECPVSLLHLCVCLLTFTSWKWSQTGCGVCPLIQLPFSYLLTSDLYSCRSTSHSSCYLLPNTSHMYPILTISICTSSRIKLLTRCPGTYLSLDCLHLPCSSSCLYHFCYCLSCVLVSILYPVKHHIIEPCFIPSPLDLLFLAALLHACSLPARFSGHLLTHFLSVLVAADC